MSKFKFSTTNTAILGNIRVSDATHHAMKSIAQLKGVTIQEVARTFLEFALDEFNKEYPEHYFATPPATTKSDKEGEGTEWAHNL